MSRIAMSLLAGPVCWVAGVGCAPTRGEIIHPGDPRLTETQACAAHATTIPPTHIHLPADQSQPVPPESLPAPQPSVNPAPELKPVHAVTPRPHAPAPDDAAATARTVAYLREIQANQQAMLKAVDDEIQQVMAAKARLDDMRNRQAVELARMQASPPPAPVTPVEYRVPAAPRPPVAHEVHAPSVEANLSIDEQQDRLRRQMAELNRRAAELKKAIEQANGQGSK